LDGVLHGSSIAPLGTATHNLARHVATALRSGTAVGGEAILISVDLAGQLTPKVVSIVREILTKAAWSKASLLIPCLTLIVIADSTGTRMRCFLGRWWRIVRCLALCLGMLGRVGRLSRRRCIVWCLVLLLLLVGLLVGLIILAGR
jgi:hypothetical protein